MEQKFGINSLNLQVLREFCEHEGKMVEYRKGDQLEREGDPARWFGFVIEGCFKYVKYGMSLQKQVFDIPLKFGTASERKLVPTIALKFASTKE